MTVDANAQYAPKQPSGIRTLAVLMIQFVLMGFVVVTPAIAVFMDHFGPDAAATGLPVTLISTLPTLTTCIGILLSGFLVGKFVKHRTMAIIATLTFTIFGFLPAIFYNYITVLICRAACGLGLGLLNPLASAIILGCYSGNKQASLLGYGTLIINGGGIVLQTLGGILADIDTSGQLVFWAHLLGFVSVIFAFLLPNPELPTTDSQGKKVKVHIPGVVWIICLVYVIFQVLNYPAMLNAGTIMMDPEHMGGNALSLDNVGFMASMALNVFTILGMIAGAAFGTVFKHMKKWVIPLGWFLCALGILCVVAGNHPVWLCVGFGLLGLGFDWVAPAYTSWIGIAANPASYPMCITAVQISQQLGAFLATFWLQLLTMTVGDAVYFPGYIEFAFCIIFTVIFLFVNPWKNKKAEEAAA
ncbi:MAG: MFS transporter [Coriobacteriales bacterium]|jgi:MFS family permease